MPRVLPLEPEYQADEKYVEDRAQRRQRRILVTACDLVMALKSFSLPAPGVTLGNREIVYVRSGILENHVVFKGVLCWPF